MKAMIPYGRHSVTEEDIEAVNAVLRGDSLTQGSHVPDFETRVAQEVGSTYGVAVNSATSALHLACLAVGLESNDILWTSPITFVASANCGRFCGAQVDFVDIDRRTGLMSIDSLKRKLYDAEKTGKLPKVIIPVHLAGASCDMKEIAELAKRYNISVIEDASHAIGGYYRGEPVGSCMYSDVTVFSFHPVKIITSGEGGMAMTNNRIFAEKMRSFRVHGITRDFNLFDYKNHGLWHYEQHNLGFNYRMSDIHAALGLSQLKRLKDVVCARSRIREYYLELLADSRMSMLGIPEGVKSAHHLAVIQLGTEKSEQYGFIFNQLRAAGVGVQLHYEPVHLQPYYRRQGFQEGDYPEAEEYSRTSISIPIYPGLSLEEQEFVADTLKSLDNA